MKGTSTVFGNLNGRDVAALFRDGVLDDLLFDANDDAIRPGAIFRARAGRSLKGQGGAILETPQGPVFLRQAKGVGAGQCLLVQVTGQAEDSKAPPATQRLVFKSRYCLVTPGAPGVNISREIRDEERRVALRECLDGLEAEEAGLVIRSAAADADDEAVRSDVETMLGLARAVLAEPVVGVPELLLDGPGAHDIGWREWPLDSVDAEPGAADRHGLPEAVTALLRSEVQLGGGARMWIEPTRALVAVDVDTGGDTSPAAALKANLAAARELPRQLRLRGLGGQICVDAAPMPKGQRKQIDQALRAALRRDPVETALVGWTVLGHIELQRKRERIPVTREWLEEMAQ
jgi:Ribonuclease G/E